ncbi:hypothetical protein D9757_006560 [Collybiopsis confluens]|uniref:Uncharacterized protein n=1 Tax=Collybiopsis confluens TaxID=2823264 RepID=A0A8H5MB94_9AGAR|nr:hypothetical protein D9757_006560 [Collybiopsis confluens]
MSIEISGPSEGGRDSMASNQSGSSSSVTSCNSRDTSTTATTTPDTSHASIESTKSLDTRKHKSPSLLRLNRTPSISRLVPHPSSQIPVPPLPTEEGLKSPKSILAIKSSVSLVETKTPTPPVLHRAQSVQFAPLPELAPRKRKSSVPLGIAARSQLMHRRKRMGSAASTFDDPNLEEDEPPSAEMRKKDRYVADGGGMWTKEEAQEHLSRQLRSKEKEREKMLKRQQKELEREAVSKDNANRELDDPLVLLGRMMKDVWRRVGKKGKPTPDPHIITQAEAESLPVAPPDLADTVVSASNDQVVQDGQLDDLANAESESSSFEEERLAELDAEEAGSYAHEVDVSKINPLRSGSPPPVQLSESSYTDADPEASLDEDGDLDSSDSDSLSTMTYPTAISSALTNPEFTSAECSDPRNSDQDENVVMESNVHALPPPDRLTSLSPLLAA